jgi:hypothetical protein
MEHPRLGDDPFQVPNYPDMIVIPFRIPPGLISPRPRRTAQLCPERSPADETAGAWPAGRQDRPGWPVQASRDASPVSATGRGPPATELAVADVRGQPGLVISGFADGALTLYRRGNDGTPPQALASFAADLDGSLWDAAGKFLGRLHGDEALFRPDWLQSIGTSLQQGAAELFGIPPAQAQEEESGREFGRRLGPGGRELDPIEENLLLRFNQAIKELRQIERHNREGTYVTGPNYVPDEATVLRVESALHAARINAVIAETLKAKGDILSKLQLTSDEAMEAGLNFVGPGYREMGGPRTGVFRSADGTRQFRIDRSSLLGRHKPYLPHIHYETIDPRTGETIATNHVVIR